MTNPNGAPEHYVLPTIAFTPPLFFAATPVYSSLAGLIIAIPCGLGWLDQKCPNSRTVPLTVVSQK